MKTEINSLQQAIRNTLVIDETDLESLSKATGISKNLLYRYCYPETSTSHAVLPLKNVVPIINFTGKTDILDFLESEINRISFRIPELNLSVNPDEVIEELQIYVYKVSITFHGYRKNNSFENYSKARNELTGLAKYVLSLAKSLDVQFTDKQESTF